LDWNIEMQLESSKEHRSCTIYYMKTEYVTDVAHGPYFPIKIDLEAKSKRSQSRGTSQGIHGSPHAPPTASPSPNYLFSAP
jgi:hypothetical protein